MEVVKQRLAEGASVKEVLVRTGNLKLYEDGLMLVLVDGHPVDSVDQMVPKDSVMAILPKVAGG